MENKMDIYFGILQTIVYYRTIIIMLWQKEVWGKNVLNELLYCCIVSELC